MSINPFTYGKPIDDPERFVGHHREVEQVYSRLLSAFESTSVVGERRTGKTSLLKYLTHPDTQAKFGLDPEKYTFIYQDFQLLEESNVPSQFWKRVLQAIKRAIKAHEDIVAEIDLAIKGETIDNYTLDDIFTLIDDQDLYIVLLMDEFEKVTRNENFDNDFFGGLRALAIHHHLALVTSSHQSLVELTHSEEVRTSPFFNIFATINLRAFSEEEATELIDKYLTNTGVKFLLSELNVIFALAGYHPHFLQMACHHLFAAHEKGVDSPTRCRYAAEHVRNEGKPLFWDYWYDSTPPEQILLIVLALRELEQDGGEVTVEALQQFYTRADQVISELERRALVTENPQNSAYHLFSTELREWIAEEIVGEAKNPQAWDNWQKDETSIKALPTGQQELLAQVVGVLKADYIETLGNWLLEPATADESLKLMETFISRYEYYLETRPQRDTASTMANEEKPVGDTPKGLFERLSKQLEGGQTVPPPKPPTPSDIDTVKLESEEVMPARILRKSKKKATANPMALGGLIISGIVTSTDLEADDRTFVKDEFEWLFSATDNLLKICRGEVERNQAIAGAIPPDSQQLPGANNQLLSTIDDSILESWKSWLETRLEWIYGWLKDLDILLGEEASRGAAAKTDLELQNKIRSKRIETVQVVEELAQLMSQAYGVLVTSPGQLIELLEE